MALAALIALVSVFAYFVVTDKRDGERVRLRYRRGVLVAIEINENTFQRNWLAIDQRRAGWEYLFGYVGSSLCGSRETVPVDLSLPTVTQLQIGRENLEVSDWVPVIQGSEPLAMISIEPVAIRNPSPNNGGFLLGLNGIDVGAIQTIVHFYVRKSGRNGRLRIARPFIGGNSYGLVVVMKRPKFDPDVVGGRLARILKIGKHTSALRVTYHLHQLPISSTESNDSSFGEIQSQRENGESEERQSASGYNASLLPAEESTFDAHLFGVAPLLGIFICLVGGGYLVAKGLEIASDPSNLFALFLYGGYIIKVFGGFGCFLLWFFVFQSFPLYSEEN